MNISSGSLVFVLFLILLNIIKSVQGTKFYDNLFKDRRVLDDEESPSIRAIVKVVCKNSDTDSQQISRISTIIKLREFFESVHNKNEKTKVLNCTKTYRDSLLDLVKVLSASNRNVCSDEKVDLIRDYHRKYISESVDDVSKRQSAIPKILKLFFIQYAFQVSATCKYNVVRNLNSQASRLDGIESSLSLPLLKSVLSELSEYINPVESVQDFDDILLAWDSVLLDGPADTDPITKEPIRLYLKVRDVNKMIELQTRCRNTLEPVYKKLIMPVVRLADCGYSADSPLIDLEHSRLTSGLKSDSVKLWYSVAQVCEALKPIKFLSDSKLFDDEVERIDRVEGRERLAAELKNSAGISTGKESQYDRIDYEPKSNSMEDFDKLPVEWDYSQKMLHSIDLEEDIIDRALRRALDIKSKNVEPLRDPLYDMF